MFGIHLQLTLASFLLVFYAQNSEVNLSALFAELCCEDFSFQPIFVLPNDQCLNSFDFSTFSVILFSVRCLHFVFLCFIYNCCVDFISGLCT